MERHTVPSYMLLHVILILELLCAKLRGNWAHTTRTRDDNGVDRIRGDPPSPSPSPLGSPIPIPHPIFHCGGKNFPHPRPRRGPNPQRNPNGEYPPTLQPIVVRVNSTVPSRNGRYITKIKFAEQRDPNKVYPLTLQPIVVRVLNSTVPSRNSRYITKIKFAEWKNIAKSV